jgi:hypothetical protein
MRRWVRTDVRGHYCLTSVREEDDTGQTSTSQRSPQGGDCRNTCMDPEMPYARRMGKEEAAVNKHSFDDNVLTTNDLHHGSIPGGRKMTSNMQPIKITVSAAAKPQTKALSVANPVLFLKSYF